MKKKRAAAPRRIRKKKNLTLSPEVIAMAEALAEFNGVEYSRLVEMWTREHFRKSGIEIHEGEGTANGTK